MFLRLSIYFKSSLYPLQIDSKNDPVREAEAREWLQAVVGEPFPEGSFQEALKDGIYLCKVISQLNPDYKVKVNKQKTPFAMVRLHLAAVAHHPHYVYLPVI